MADGSQVPGIAPAAKQEGAYVGRVIRARMRGLPPPPAFRYRHRGNFATIGKGAGVVHIGRLQLRGRLAWWVWGLAHIFFLIGTRSRAIVAWNWLWIYLMGQHSARLITQGSPYDTAGKRDRDPPDASKSLSAEDKKIAAAMSDPSSDQTTGADLGAGLEARRTKSGDMGGNRGA